MERLLLGAYQMLDYEPYESEQYGPNTLRVKLTTAMDDPFTDRTVTAILSANSQKAIIETFTANLKEEA